MFSWKSIGAISFSLLITVTGFAGGETWRCKPWTKKLHIVEWDFGDAPGKGPTTTWNGTVSAYANANGVIGPPPNTATGAKLTYTAATKTYAPGVVTLTNVAKDPVTGTGAAGTSLLTATHNGIWGATATAAFGASLGPGVPPEI
jgi:hypothetical protein